MLRVNMKEKMSTALVILGVLLFVVAASVQIISEYERAIVFHSDVLYPTCGSGFSLSVPCVDQ